MANVPLIRTMQIAAVIFTFGFIASGQTPAAEQATPVIQLVAGDSSSRFVPLGVGKSVVIDLPRDIKDVLVADPTIANAVVRTARRAYIIGVKTGQTNVFFFDADGQERVHLVGRHSLRCTCFHYEHHSDRDCEKHAHVHLTPFRRCDRPRLPIRAGYTPGCSIPCPGRM